MGGREDEEEEETNVNLRLIYVDVWQKHNTVKKLSFS